jgi:ABC-2 type transport system ATP-binding protein
MAAPAPRDTPASDTVVELADVYKTFHQRQRSERLSDALRNLLRPRIHKVEALREVSLRVRRGEIVAYAGPNGAGKSTTIKLLSSLLAPDSGSVRVLGMDPVRERERCVARIGVVFGQRTELWWDHPVAASYDWKRVVWDIPDARYARMLGFVKEVLGLEPFFQTLARELSLGQRMRADLGMALLHEPELLLLDEPTLGLDVLAKRSVLRFIKELNGQTRMTVVVTSHDMADLEQLAGRIVLVDRGRLAFDGEFSRLRREFADRRHLLIETGSPTPPALRGADLVRSEGGRHEYVFDASRAPITDLLQQAADQGRIMDVETHQALIDDVIADIYERWQRPEAGECATASQPPHCSSALPAHE